MIFVNAHDSMIQASQRLVDFEFTTNVSVDDYTRQLAKLASIVIMQ